MTPDAQSNLDRPAELIVAQEWAALEELLLDVGFLRAKLAARGPFELVADYAAAEDAREQAGLPATSPWEDVRQLGATLRLSSHVLARDPRQLCTQLVGRLAGTDRPGLHAFLPSWNRPKQRRGYALCLRIGTGQAVRCYRRTRAMSTRRWEWQ